MGTNDAYGQPTLGPPIELSVRWNDKQTEMLDAKGNTIAVDATVVVDRFIPVGSAMWLGRLTDLPGPVGEPEPERGAMWVRSYNATSDLKGRATFYTVGLVRSRDKLPGFGG